MLAPRRFRGTTSKPAGTEADSNTSGRLGALVSWIPDRGLGRGFNVAAAETAQGHEKSREEKMDIWNRYCMILTGSFAKFFQCYLGPVSMLSGEYKHSILNARSSPAVCSRKSATAAETSR